MGIATWGVCRDGTPIINIASGRNAVERRLRADKVVDSYAESNRRMGYRTAEEAYDGKRIKAEPPVKECKKTLRQRVKEWFTEVVE